MTEKAVAVKYHEGLPAPFVIAQGRRKTAERLVEIAKENGIVIVKEESLAERLMVIEVGEWIPEELYGIMAEVLAFVYTLEK